MAHLYLDNRINEVDAQKTLCFIDNWEKLVGIKEENDNTLISYVDATECIVDEIKKQIKIREQ